MLAPLQVAVREIGQEILDGLGVLSLNLAGRPLRELGYQFSEVGDSNSAGGGEFDSVAEVGSEFVAKGAESPP